MVHRHKKTRLVARHNNAARVENLASRSQLYSLTKTIFIGIAPIFRTENNLQYSEAKNNNQQGYNNGYGHDP